MAELEAIGITTADLASSLRFYGLLGIQVPLPARTTSRLRWTAGCT